MNKANEQNPRRRTLAITLAALFLCLLLACISIAKQFIGLNASVEYERSVFITQIAEQMKKNLLTSREIYLANTRGYAAALESVSPKTFAQAGELFPQYAENKTPNRLFFLSSDCELYGIDGVKQWASLPYDEYFIDVLSQEHTTNFIRIGIDQEFMSHSARISTPVFIEGHEISAVLFGWDSSQYRSTLSSKLFEVKSSSLLVGTNGNIAIYPEDEDSESYGYNIYTYLTSQGMTEEDLNTIQNLLGGTGDRTALCEVAGERWLFSASYYSELYKVFIMLPIQITSAGTYQNLYGLIFSVVAAFLTLFFMVAAILLSVGSRQRAQREKELQTELLMKTAQAKNEFLAKMSHDIRTPLNGIIGMNYIASTQTPPECSQVRESLKKVDTAANYLLGILNDILDMSKIESGELKLSAKPFSMTGLRDEIASLMALQMEGSEVRFVVDVPENIGYDYIGDSLRLKQILINLLSNAVKFTEKGSITLTVRIHPSAGDTDEVTFSVRDTGKGMSREFMSHIFTPFTQEDDSIAAAYGGSGLGLSITKSFVDLMGGAITVSSQPGVGSEFTVTLLLQRAEPVTQENVKVQEAEAFYSFAGKRLLLCEDNDLNAEIAVAILECYDLEVDRAENGKVGVELFRQSPPGYYAMILMDVRMPQMDGYEATRAIRGLERPDAQQVPVCALSANAFSDDIVRSLEAGMNEHLAKPLDVSLLAEVLRKYLEK